MPMPVYIYANDIDLIQILLRKNTDHPGRRRYRTCTIHGNSRSFRDIHSYLGLTLSVGFLEDTHRFLDAT